MTVIILIRGWARRWGTRPSPSRPLPARRPRRYSQASTRGLWGRPSRSQIWAWLGPVPPLEEYRVVRRDIGQACPLFRRPTGAIAGVYGQRREGGVAGRGTVLRCPAGPLQGPWSSPCIHPGDPPPTVVNGTGGRSVLPEVPSTAPFRPRSSTPGPCQRTTRPTAELTYQKVAYPHKRRTGLLQATGRQVCHRALEYIPTPYGTIVRIEPHGHRQQDRGHRASTLPSAPMWSTGAARHHPQRPVTCVCGEATHQAGAAIHLRNVPCQAEDLVATTSIRISIPAHRRIRMSAPLHGTSPRVTSLSLAQPSSTVKVLARSRLPTFPEQEGRGGEDRGDAGRAFCRAVLAADSRAWRNQESLPRNRTWAPPLGARSVPRAPTTTGLPRA